MTDLHVLGEGLDVDRRARRFEGGPLGGATEVLREEGPADPASPEGRQDVATHLEHGRPVTHGAPDLCVRDDLPIDLHDDDVAGGVDPVFALDLDLQMFRRGEPRDAVASFAAPVSAASSG